MLKTRISQTCTQGGVRGWVAQMQCTTWHNPPIASCSWKMDHGWRQHHFFCNSQLVFMWDMFGMLQPLACNGLIGLVVSLHGHAQYLWVNLRKGMVPLIESSATPHFLEAFAHIYKERMVDPWMFVEHCSCFSRVARTQHPVEELKSNTFFCIDTSLMCWNSSSSCAHQISNFLSSINVKLTTFVI